MKRNNKKGFTITELVIVIAVIAILAAVLIPTFSGVIDKAKKSTATQECAQARQNLLVERDADLSGYNWYFIHEEGYAFSLINGEWEEISIAQINAAAIDFVYLNEGNAHIIEEKDAQANPTGNYYLEEFRPAGAPEAWVIAENTEYDTIADLSGSVVIVAIEYNA